jgi:hypothetical protein
LAVSSFVLVGTLSALPESGVWAIMGLVGTITPAAAMSKTKTLIATHRHRCICSLPVEQLV